MNRLTKTALAFACAIASSGTFAAAQSSASISDLTFQVIDLDLSDGAGSSFQFSNAGRTLLSLNASNGVSGESDSYSRNRLGWLVPGSFASDLSPVSASATINATGISLQGEALGRGNYSASGSTGDDYYWYYGTSYLTLSARSMVVVTGKASVFASATNPSADSCGWGYCSASETASASATMQLNYSYYSGNTSMSYSFSEALNANAYATAAHTQSIFDGYEIVATPWGNYWYPRYRNVDVAMTEQTMSQEKTFTAVFVNSSDVAQSARMYLGASISGVGTTPLAAPVPEPETWALAAAGLLLVGARARRMRQQA